MERPVGHAQPLSSIAAFHASWVLDLSSDERHTCERNRSVVIKRNSKPD
jgi:hypothetical protein